MRMTWMVSTEQCYRIVHFHTFAILFKNVILYDMTQGFFSQMDGFLLGFGTFSGASC